MKKLSVLIALVLCVTIGGVYAAWNYSQGNTASVNVSREINMAQVVTNGIKGTITATPQNNFAFLVDDIANDPDPDNEGSFIDIKYKAVLVGTGDILINFTANPGADQTTKDNGIKMIATITLSAKDNLKYTDPHKSEDVVPITVKTGANVIALEITEDKDGEPVIKDGEPDITDKATITAQEIVDCLELADVKLDTKAENDAFHTALKDYTIVITISEYIETTGA